jgi:hypothetical protein
MTWKTPYLYVMIFLLKQQRWSNAAYELFKNSIYQVWLQNQTYQQSAIIGDPAPLGSSECLHLQFEFRLTPMFP